MNVRIFHNENEITQKVISYKRNQSICDGVGNAQLETTLNNSFLPYDTIEIFENDIKKGTYYIDTVSKQNDRYNLFCIDGSKFLKDFFITDIIDCSTQEYYTKDLIEIILNKANVAYIFDTEENNHIVQNMATVGPGIASELLLPLLQQSGWYIYCDAYNVFHISKVFGDFTNIKASFTDLDIEQISTYHNDKLLRNRVVVWGSTNPFTNEWAFADLSIITPSNYDENDKRTLVIWNGLVDSISTATDIAKMALDEFSQDTLEIHLTLVGDYEVSLADTVFVSSKYFNGVGIVTSCGSQVDAGGFLTHVILNQRCPRLVVPYIYKNGYVYIGTDGNGIWRKKLTTDHTWENFSDGLENLNVTDLQIKNGVFACVADHKLYTRTVTDSSWSLIDINEATSSGIVYSGLDCMACTINPLTNNILAIYNRSNKYIVNSGVFSSLSGAKSWLMDITLSGEYNEYPITISGEEDLSSYDLDITEKSTYVSTVVGRSMIYTLENSTCRNSSYFNVGTGLLTPLNSSSSYNTVENLYNENTISKSFGSYYRNCCGDYLFWLSPTFIARKNYRDDSETYIYRAFACSFFSIVNTNTTINGDDDLDNTFSFYYTDFSNSSVLKIYDESGIYGTSILDTYNRGISAIISDYSKQKTFVIFHGRENSHGYGNYKLWFNYINIEDWSYGSKTLICAYPSEYTTNDVHPESIVETEHYIYGMVLLVTGYPASRETILYRIDKQNLTSIYTKLPYGIGVNQAVPEHVTESAIFEYKDFSDSKYKIGKVQVVDGILNLTEIVSGDETPFVYRLISTKNTWYYTTTDDKIYSSTGVYLAQLDFNDISMIGDDWDDGVVILKGSSVYKYYAPDFISNRLLASGLSIGANAEIVIMGQNVKVGTWALFANNLNINKATNYILEQDNSDFNVVAETAEIQNIEYNRTPIMSYAHCNSGNLEWGSSYYSMFGYPWYYIDPLPGSGYSAVYDMRSYFSGGNIKVVQVRQNAESVTLVKQFTLDQTSDIIYPEYEVVFSGEDYATHIETTNYNYYTSPYIFVSTSGETPNFFQKDKDTTNFVERNINLPSSNITVIRTDDIL